MFLELWDRLHAWLRGRHLDRELDDEMQFHLEMKIEKNLAAGMSPAEARRTTLRDFGGAEQMKEACRGTRHTWLDSVWQDVRYSVRCFRRDRAFTITAILTLAIGIGATTSTYSIVDGILFRPLPYKDPDRVVMLLGRNPKSGQLWELLPQTAFTALHGSHSFETVAAYDWRIGALTITGGGPAESINTAEVSSDFFRALGVYPILGRAFRGDEGGPGKETGILTYGFWKRRFGGDRAIIGRTVAFQEKAVTIVGVLPSGFWYPRTTAKGAPDLLLASPVDWTSTKGGGFLLGRLRNGASLTDAQVEASVVSARLPQMKLQDGSHGDVFVSPLRSQMVLAQHDSLLAVLGAVVFLLLIACVNVANLMLAHGRVREREFAIRSSLGAGRLRIARQLLTESALLALVGGAVGVLVSYWTFDLLLAQVPEALRPVRDILIDRRALASSALATLSAVALFGVVPALDASRPDLMSALKIGIRRRDHLQRMPVRGLLLVVEVGLALVLLVGAGLLANSFVRLQHVDVGFNPSNVTVVFATAPKTRYPSNGQVAEFYRQATERLRSVGGVESVATADMSPLSSALMGAPARIEGVSGEEHPETWRVSSGYFDTVGLRLVEGRLFGAREDEKPASAAIVNEAMVRRYWPDGSAIGRRMTVWLDTPVRIVGVVRDARTALRDPRTGARKPIMPTVFVPYDVAYPRYRWRAFVMRTRAKYGNLDRAIQSAIGAVDPDIAVTPLRLDESVARAVAAPRFYALVVSLFAAIGLLLSAVGIAGVAAHDVLRRTHEIGVRMALGASARSVVAAMATHAAIPIAVGLAIGIAAAIALTRVLASLLFEIKPRDPLTFAAVSALLAAVALLATYLPARRAAKVDPIEVLRAE